MILSLEPENIAKINLRVSDEVNGDEKPEKIDFTEEIFHTLILSKDLKEWKNKVALHDVKL